MKYLSHSVGRDEAHDLVGSVVLSAQMSDLILTILTLGHIPTHYAPEVLARKLAPKIAASKLRDLTAYEALRKLAQEWPGYKAGDLVVIQEWHIWSAQRTLGRQFEVTQTRIQVYRGGARIQDKFTPGPAIPTQLVWRAYIDPREWVWAK